MVNPAGNVKLNCKAAIFCPFDPVIPIDRVTGLPAVTEDGPEGVMVVVCPNKVRGSSRENRRRRFAWRMADCTTRRYLAAHGTTREAPRPAEG